MRMEAKNSYFKRIAQQGNFKNISLSVAKRHQKLMCALLQSDDFFENALDKSNGKYIYVLCDLCNTSIYMSSRTAYISNVLFYIV